MIEVTPELLARHDRPGPRYTSYPTAVDFDASVGPEVYAECLRDLSRRAADPVALYVHLPFCAARCSFCACHVVVTRAREVSEVYLRHIRREAHLVRHHLGSRRRVVQYHWGGGTPTHHPPEDLVALHGSLLEDFELDQDAEMSVEVDPRVTSDEHLEALAALGFNRVSLGVQDLDPEVQALIGRNQTPQQTEHLHRHARRLGFRSVNFDLVYGLPGQTTETLSTTLDTVSRLRPDRLAVYSFAYVPWMRRHQRRIDSTRLPASTEKFELLALVVARLTEAGYRRIGMDHFALPDDDLSRAAAEGTLTRNFMGYTTARDTEVVALGTSGISDVAGTYAQNHRRLASYYEAVDAGRLPVERGYRLSAADRIRRWVITELMCNGVVDLAKTAERFGVDRPERFFVTELDSLEGPGGITDQGLAEVHGLTVRATELGMLFVRRIAAVFDTHSRRHLGEVPRFSQTI